MTDVTPEQARTAVTVLRAYSKLRSPEIRSRDLCWSASEIDEWANRLEREQAAKVERDKRIREVADTMHDMRSRGYTWAQIAKHLAVMFPCLIDAPQVKS